jgi:hypothetical protein
MVEREFNELIRILDSENGIYQKYLGLLTEQQDHLINNNIYGIRLTIERINQLAQSAMSLETARLGIIENISATMNTSPENLTIGKLLEKFKGPKFQELEQLKNKILATYDQVMKQKSRNETLIDQSMRIIGHTMNLICGTDEPPATYEDIISPAKIPGKAKAFMTRTY